MTAFQLDQNTNHKQLARDCNAEGSCRVLRLPRELIDKDDSVVLSALLTKEAALLTMDFEIVEGNKEHIPARNAGIIIVKARPNTANLFRRLLVRFKENFPSWPQLDWSQLYLEIDESEVYVSALLSGDIEGGISIRFDTPEFASAFERAVTEMKQKSKPKIAAIAKRPEDGPPSSDA